MFMLFFFFKQKTAYEMRISDWSSDVCSSDLEAAFDAVEHLVADADVGERAAHHHIVVAAARAVAVEVGRLHAARLQELARGRIVLDVAGRRDVVGGDRFAEQAQHSRTVDVRDSTPAPLPSHEVRTATVP